jgi:hypothetical protein
MSRNKVTYPVLVTGMLDQGDQGLDWVWAGGAAPAGHPLADVGLGQLLHLRHHKDGGGYRHQEQQVCNNRTLEQPTADVSIQSGTTVQYLLGIQKGAFSEFRIRSRLNHRSPHKMTMVLVTAVICGMGLTAGIPMISMMPWLLGSWSSSQGLKKFPGSY